MKSTVDEQLDEEVKDEEEEVAEVESHWYEGTCSSLKELVNLSQNQVLYELFLDAMSVGGLVSDWLMVSDFGDSYHI